MNDIAKYTAALNSCMGREANLTIVIESIREHLASGYLVLLSGQSRTGKTWLINQLKSDLFLIDKKRKATRQEPLELTPTELDRIINTKYPIAVDEALTIKPLDLVDIRKACTNKHLGTIIAAQDLCKVKTYFKNEPLVFEVEMNRYCTLAIRNYENR